MTHTASYTSSLYKVKRYRSKRLDIGGSRHTFNPKTYSFIILGSMIQKEGN